MTWPPSVIKVAEAVKKAEGSNPLWNNPGSLTGSDAGGFQTFGTANAEGVLIFANAEDGWNALCIKIARILKGKSTVYPPTMTLENMGLKYSGGDPNWAKNVGEFLGVPVTITLADLTRTLAPESATNEGELNT